MQIPILSIIFMSISAILSIGLPIFLFIVFYKKFNVKFIPMLFGIAGFIVFALVLESSVHFIVLTKNALMNKPVIYIFYGIFMAGIFEETARFISFKILKKKYEGIGTGLAYGVGHGGIEAVIIVGVSMITNIVFSIIANTGNMEAITGVLQGRALEQITLLQATSPHLFLIGGIERIFAMSIQISLSIIVFYSVYGKNKLWLYPFSVILHAIINIPASMMQVGLIGNIYLVELLAFISAVILVIIAWYIHKKLKQDTGEYQ